MAGQRVKQRFSFVRNRPFAVIPTWEGTACRPAKLNRLLLGYISSSANTAPTQRNPSGQARAAYHRLADSFGWSSCWLLSVLMAIDGVVRLLPPQASSSSSVAVWGTRTVRRGLGTVRCRSSMGTRTAGGLAEEHYRTLRLRPGASRGEVKKAFRRLALTYHPDVCKQSGNGDGGVHFQRISVAYQMLMSNMRETEERLQYWKLKYGLSDEDLDRYRYYINDHDDDWFDL